MRHLGAGIVFVVAIVGFSGCATFGGSLLSTHDEILLGVTLAKEVESSELLLDDEGIREYVDFVGRRLVRVADRTHIPYTFKVLDDDTIVDAFALPGGYMYVFTGLLLKCENEAELAGVMAHELGHVIARHHGKVLSRDYGFDLLTGQLLGSDKAATGTMRREVLESAMALDFDDRFEREADDIGLALMIEAGYQPEAKITFLLKIYDERAPKDHPHTFSTTHAPRAERIDRLYEKFLTYPDEVRNSTALYEERYRDEVLSRLK